LDDASDAVAVAEALDDGEVEASGGRSSTEVEVGERGEWGDDTTGSGSEMCMEVGHNTEIGELGNGDVTSGVDAEGLYWLADDGDSGTLSNVEDLDELARETGGECCTENRDEMLSVRRFAVCIRSCCFSSACFAHSCRAFINWSDCSWYVDG
jgi:hypothetical protein